MLPQATIDIEPSFIKSEEDIISYCLFPEPSLEYFRWRNLPPEKRPPIPADLEKNKKTTAAKESLSNPVTEQFLSPQDYEKLNSIIERISELDLNEIIIRKGEHSLSLGPSGAQVKGGNKKAMQAKTGKTKPKKETETSAVKEVPKGPTVDAPLNGTFYTSSGPGQAAFVKEGDKVKAGGPVCIVEAMKLFNQINAPYDCRIVKILADHGQAVQKGDPLVAIEKI